MKCDNPLCKKVCQFIPPSSGFTYCCEAWILSARDDKVLDGVYTRMLRVDLNVSWEDHTSNINLYDKLPQLSDKLRQRHMRLARHCVRHKELSACELILWGLMHGQCSNSCLSGKVFSFGIRRRYLLFRYNHTLSS